MTTHEEDQEKTFTCAIIKPDAVKAGLIGTIISKIEAHPTLFIDMIKRLAFSEVGAANFYSVHEGKDFYDDLVEFMSSGEIFALALVSDGDAVNEWRTLMTDIRDEYGMSVMHNCVHGSDSEDTAHEEIAFVFAAELEAANPLMQMLGGGGMPNLDMMDDLDPSNLPEGFMEMLQEAGADAQIVKVGLNGEAETISAEEFAEIVQTAEAEAELESKDGKLDA